MGSHSVTCHPAAVTFPPLPQPKLVLDLATLGGYKAELRKKGKGKSEQLYIALHGTNHLKVLRHGSHSF